MGNLFCIAGHNIAKPGALAFNGKYEHQYTREQQRLIAGKHRVVQYEGSIILDSEDMTLVQVIDDINGNSRPGDYGIDLHFNNNNPAATGVEVFVHPATTKLMKKIATAVVNELAGIMDIPVRRYIARRDYKYPAESAPGRLGIIERTDIPMMLLETCFLNEGDLAKYMLHKQEVADAIIRCFKQYKRLHV